MRRVSRSVLAAHAVQGAQVDQDIDQGGLVGDGLAIAQSGPFNAQFDGLSVDPLGGGALLVDLFVSLTVAVELVAQASADTGGDSGGTAALGPVLVVDGTGLTGRLWEIQGEAVLGCSSLRN